MIGATVFSISTRVMVLLTPRDEGARGCKPPKDKAGTAISKCLIGMAALIVGKISFAGDSPAPGEYVKWFNENVGTITDNNPLFCSDVVFLGRKNDTRTRGFAAYLHQGICL